MLRDRKKSASKGRETARCNAWHGRGEDAGMGEDTVTELIERLASGAAGSAWKEFLDCYSPLIRHVVRRHQDHFEHGTECFDYVCGALSDDHFRRLRSFRPEGPARFRTWLTAVVSNLCRDWRRTQWGRDRPFQAISRLPPLDQEIYQHVFVEGMSRADCLESLAPRFPGLTKETVAQISARLFSLLTPQQRWQLSSRAQFAHRPATGATGEVDDPTSRSASPEPGPDDLVAELQERQRVREALSMLPPEQRLLLRLRYEQDLTLAEVAHLTRQPDPFRTNRKIQAALKALAGLMETQRTLPERKKP
jgi:RNA polymerase sigma factor (sigma-70 family)